MRFHRSLKDTSGFGRARHTSRSGMVGLLLLLVGVLVGPGASGQSIRDLATGCTGGQADLADVCRELALTVQAVQGAVGLAGAGGSDIPGSPSTVGRRLGSVPRVGISLSASAMRVAMPDVVKQGGTATPQETFTLPALRVGVVVGLLDGFSVTPGVGGILSLDLLGAYSRMFLADGAGFDSGRSGFGIGGRMGILRESFTLPGVSVSVMRRSIGTVQLGDVGAGGPAQATLDVTTTSIRGTVGKNLVALGLMAGVGWDRYSSDVNVTGRGPPGSDLLASASLDGVTSDRTLYFVSGWFNFLVYQISGEAGWAQGYERELDSVSGADYDPESGALFASLAFRITF